MGMIFPGMDPYLEDPLFWHGVHQRFTVYLADHLQPLLGERYIASIEERVYLEGPDREVAPDVWLRQDRSVPRGDRPVPADTRLPILVEASELEIHENYVTILDRHSEQEVVAVIEIVSPTNKYAGPGRVSYLTKQREVRGSRSHLIEIDLLRTGPHVLAVPLHLARRQGMYDYLVSVNRAVSSRHVFELYPIRLRDALPPIRIPLADKDPDVLLDLRPALEQVYRAGLYHNRLRYNDPCMPPLPPEDQEWATELIRQAQATS
ncbi:MAG: DUF4058 family protein [Gemmataceae bacterium]|nr:DUF4058 family protein [Gemmataceae bacterium]